MKKKISHLSFKGTISSMINTDLELLIVYDVLWLVLI